MPALPGFTRCWSSVLLLLAAGCRDSAPPDQRTVGDSSGGTPGAPEAAVVAATEGSYELELPTRWKGHYRVDSLSTAERGRARPGAFVFQYLPSDAALRPQALLAVAVYDSATWRVLRAEPGPPPGDSVAAGAGLVYVAGLPQSNPFAPGTPDAAVFAVLQLRPAEVARLVRLR